MNERDEQSGHDELERLYRRAGDVEPDPALDRRIRTMGRDAAHHVAGREPVRSPARWIGGLATAAVAVLAIGVIVEQAQPPSRAPAPPAVEEALAPQTDAVPAARPAASADRAEAGDAAVLERRQRNAADVAGVSEREAAAPEPARREAPVPAVEAKPELSAFAGDAPGEIALPSESLLLLATIREAIAEDDLERARELLATFREMHPDIEVPADIRENLKPAGAENP